MRDAEQILAALARALNALVADEDMAHANPGEQAVTGKLAILMEPHFPGWTVSPEWDRREAEEKRLAWNDEKGKERLRKIRPDIIVHHVGIQENLLVVEAKRLGKNKNHENDIAKLKGMTLQTGEYRYEVGVHLILDLPKCTVVANDVYKDGALHPKLTAWLSKRLTRN